MPTYEQELVTVARTVSRIQDKIRKLKKELKEAQSHLRLEQRHLRALAQHAQRPDIAPSRLTNGATGLAPQPERPAPGVCDCIVSGNVAKPLQHGTDPHAKNCNVYYVPLVPRPVAVPDRRVEKFLPAAGHPVYVGEK